MLQFSSRPSRRGYSFLFVLLLLFSGCKHDKKDEQKVHTDPVPTSPAVLTLGAYTTPREAYGKSILPAFREKWRKQAGADLEFRESYLGSGAQARAIVAGFEADVAALSLEADIDTLKEAGLIRHDWKSGKHEGIVTRSVVVIGVREGNPKNIRTWQDLARPDVAVLTPNVRTSGGAMWNVLALYGAAIRGHAGTIAGDQEAAVSYMAAVLRNVKIMDRGARDSMLTFERGVGDAIITYENEILVGRAEGKHYDYIAPHSTILIENPAAIVDANTERHHSHEVAQAFLDFLVTPEAQRAFAKYGLRPVLESIESEVKGQFVAVEDLFTIRDLGGWGEAQRLIFAPGGIYDRALTKSQEKVR
jgi:sulfate/thiosulfate transport system substrate-binding protein